ncbi:MAG TPA: CDP-alcohol phosphatidyltransferase family protein, partial [Candidatus Omnitrophota bacterium]|nr:CDP-alcohol phosphatidyltransferase family protein [Candidatus Omnitrophota bacterium]
TPEKNFLKIIALLIFLLAIISDVIDGYIARTKRQKTKAGAILDPLADKALLITAFIFVRYVSIQYFHVVLPLWVLLIVISRDIIILIGSGILLATGSAIEIKPTWWGKLTTFFQMSTIISVIMEHNYSWIFWTMACIFTVISGIDYVRKGINALNNSTGVYHKTDHRITG